ncbi:MAG: efflux RND transporter periplasmic adaptor subunit [Pseudomonadota bacterium]
MRAVLIALSLAIGGPLWAQSAVLEPALSAEMRSTVPGRIAELAVSEGAVVEAGTLLARIDGNVQSARVELARLAAEAQGGLARAETVLAQSADLAERLRDAAERGAAQSWEVNAASQAEDLARADLVIARELQARAAAELALEEARLAEFDIRAPFSGTVLEIFLAPGEIADTQTVIMEFGAFDRLRATAFVSPDRAAELSPGSEVEGRIDGIAAQARVTAIDPRLDPVSQTVRIALEIENGDGRFAIGAGFSLTGG